MPSLQLRQEARSILRRPLRLAYLWQVRWRLGHHCLLDENNEGGLNGVANDRRATSDDSLAQMWRQHQS